MAAVYGFILGVFINVSADLVMDWWRRRARTRRSMERRRNRAAKLLAGKSPPALPPAPLEPPADPS